MIILYDGSNVPIILYTLVLYCLLCYTYETGAYYTCALLYYTVCRGARRLLTLYYTEWWYFSSLLLDGRWYGGGWKTIQKILKKDRKRILLDDPYYKYLMTYLYHIIHPSFRIRRSTSAQCRKWEYYYIIIFRHNLCKLIHLIVL